MNVTNNTTISNGTVTYCSTRDYFSCTLEAQGENALTSCNKVICAKDASVPLTISVSDSEFDGTCYCGIQPGSTEEKVLIALFLFFSCFYIGYAIRMIVLTRKTLKMLPSISLRTESSLHTMILSGIYAFFIFTTYVLRAYESISSQEIVHTKWFYGLSNMYRVCLCVMFSTFVSVLIAFTVKLKSEKSLVIKRILIAKKVAYCCFVLIIVFLVVGPMMLVPVSATVFIFALGYAFIASSRIILKSFTATIGPSDGSTGIRSTKVLQWFIRNYGFLIRDSKRLLLLLILFTVPFMLTNKRKETYLANKLFTFITDGITLFMVWRVSEFLHQKYKNKISQLIRSIKTREQMVIDERLAAEAKALKMFESSVVVPGEETTSIYSGVSSSLLSSGPIESVKESLVVDNH